MSVKAYFGNIWEGCSSIFEGMTITFSHLFRKPVTLQYPDLPKPLKECLPERSRGFLKVDIPICTACLACQVACPIDCIKIELEKDKERKQKNLTRFDIDMGKCMYCGLCTEPCPTGAIHFTREFEKSTEGMDELVFRFVDKGDRRVAYDGPPPKTTKG